MTIGWAWAIGGLVLGAIVGSFLATVAVRWPAGRSALRGRSRCDACGRTLGPAELIPLLSFALQRGRCRACGGAIDPRHPGMEATAAVIGLVALLAAPGPVGLVGAAFGWTLLLLAVLDIEHLWLPDVVTLPLGAAGLLLGLAGIPPAPVDRVIGAAAGFTALFVIAAAYRRVRGREGMGGGDPKLFGAIGAWLGWAALPIVLLLASAVGLIAVLTARMRGTAIAGDAALPFGALLAVAAYPVWIVMLGWTS